MPAMKLTLRPGHGIIFVSRFGARRLPKDWAAVESPPLPRRFRPESNPPAAAPPVPRRRS
jgi:hypothetical protein